MYSLVLFAARSTKGITRLSPTERASVKLPDEVKEVLIGILLGDSLLIVAKRRSFLGYLYSRYYLRFLLCFINFSVVYPNPQNSKATVLKENKGRRKLLVFIYEQIKLMEKDI